MLGKALRAVSSCGTALSTRINNLVFFKFHLCFIHSVDRGIVAVVSPGLWDCRASRAWLGVY